MRAIGAPCKGKSLRVHYTFAPSGRSYIAFTTQGAASLALGYGIAGPSARCATEDGLKAQKYLARCATEDGLKAQKYLAQGKRSGALGGECKCNYAL